MSPLQRTLAKLRADGYTVGITEKWNPHAHIRQDFCGFADCLAFRPDTTGVLAVNAMLLRNRNAHEKFKDNTAIPRWLAAGNRFVMHQWHKVGPRGQVKRWECEIVEVT